MTILFVLEIAAADVTVFDKYVDKVNYQFKLLNSDFTPTACYVLIKATEADAEDEVGFYGFL